MKSKIAGVVCVSSLMSALCVSEVSFAVGTRRVALRDGADFSSGKLEGVAVDSVGRVRASFNLGAIPVEAATNVWSTLRMNNGNVLIATGNEGKLLELSKGAVKEVAKAEALALTSLVEAWGSVFAASLPNGKIYEYKAGKLSEWLTLKDAEHIMQLAFDRDAGVLYAATGPQGKLYRITKDKKAQVYLDVEEEHLASVAVGNGKVYVGGGDKAKLYQVDGPGRASVLYDFGRTEVRAIVVAKSGEVFAIANELSSKPPLPSSTKNDNDGPGPSASSGGRAKGKGTLFRFSKQGAPEQLLDDTSEHYTSLALDENGQPYVGTGSEGKLYTVDANRNSVLAADVEERQLSALLMAGKEPLLFASDPAVIHPVRAVGGADSIWTSKAVDAGLRAHFGRLDWSSEGAVELSIRSGNAAEPDDTWSPWGAWQAQPHDIQSPAARFFQVRARFGLDAKAELREVTVSFTTDNLRPTLGSVQFENASSKSLTGPDDKLVASGGPISERPDEDVQISWKVDNPDKDDLRYWLKYKREGTRDWFDILKPSEKLTKTSYSWDTADLPEGRYRVRVIVSDVLSNTPQTALTHQLDSHIVLVDNTAPELRDLRVQGRTLSGLATDGVGPIARIEVAVAGSDEWYAVAPTDGVFDEATEEFRVELGPILPAGPALLTVRAYDQENNRVVAGVTLP